jgi:hypothetical protein
VTGQLIDSADGTHIWAERFDRDLTDIFAIQDEITRAIVEQLKVKLLPQKRSPSDKRRPIMSKRTLITCAAATFTTGIRNGTSSSRAGCL